MKPSSSVTSLKHLCSLYGLVAALSSCGSETPSTTLAATADQLTDGVWAKQMILTSESSALGIRSTSKIERLLLVKMSKQGDRLETSEQVCDVSSTASGGASLVFPKAFKQIIPPRQTTYQLQPSGGLVQLVGTTTREVLGARLQDAARDALPSSSSDPAVFDQDGDGQPGVTVEVSASALFVTIKGNVYVTQRTITQETGYLEGDGLIRGKIAWSNEQHILGSDSRVLASVSPSTRELLDQSEFTMRRLDGEATCVSLLGQYDRLFVRP